RNHVGCDFMSETLVGYIWIFQFTHQRGMRRCPPCSVEIRVKFQFTHPRGMRLGISKSEYEKVRFQFTHPRGMRLDGEWLDVKLSKDFNSRTHEGCDRS